MRNHLGQYECRLCLTLHNNEGNYLAHTQVRPSCVCIIAEPRIQPIKTGGLLLVSHCLVSGC